MRVEFKTVFSEAECRKFGEYAIKYCSPEYDKALKRNIIVMAILTAIIIILGILSEIYVASVIFSIAFILHTILLIYNRNNKAPQSLYEANSIGCPFNVTFGFYDEYFYEKFENNMTVEECSIRYEFLDYIVETPEYFLLLTKRRRGFIFHKGYMNPNDVPLLSAFFKTRFPNVYKFKEN